MKRFLNALRFLTIIPVPGMKHADLSSAGKSAAFFPIVGLIIGGLLTAAACLSALVWSSAAQAASVTAVWVIITGGLHLDGLADLADGLGGGWDRESRLKIMKDSLIGTYGALAIVIMLLMKAVLLYEISSCAVGGRRFYTVLILTPVVGRFCMVLSIRIFKTAKTEGFGYIFKSSVRTIDAAAAAVITALLLFAAWGFAGFIVMAAAVLFMLAAARWISLGIGGLNGDSYGAICELSELFCLLLISSLSSELLEGLFWV